MSGIQNIMISKKGLEHIDNYHEFCRLLGRLKASYQLSELVKTKGFLEWLEMAGDFTIKSLQNWQYSMNSIHYLLALWGRLVAALPYLRTEGIETQRPGQVLRQCVLQVVESYIKTMLDSVDIVIASDGAVEDPLDDEGSLKEQMDRLPVIARLQYDTVAQYLITLFEQVLSMYQSAGNLGGNQIIAMEGRLTWLTQMVGAVIGAQAAVDPRKNNDELLWDGRLCRCVYQLVQIVDFRMVSSGGKSKCDEKLEMAILTFFRSFKKCYMLDTISLTPPTMGMAPGASPAHPLLSFALSVGEVAPAPEKETGMEPTTVFFFSNLK
jgi:exportin-7